MSAEIELPNEISADGLERLTGLKDRQHRNISKAGYFPPPRNGQYEFEATIKGMFQYRDDEAKKKQGELAKVKLEREQNRNRQDKVAADEAEQKVVSKEDARRVVTRYVAGLKHRMLALPLRVGQRFALETDPQTISTFLEKEIREAVSGATEFKYGLAPCPTCHKPANL